MRTWTMSAAALAALLAAPALAQMDRPDRPNGVPPMAGPISRAEVQAQVREHFAAVDADHDGAISRSEFEAARAAMRDRFGGPPAGGPEGAGAEAPGPEGAADAGGPPPPSRGMGRGGGGMGFANMMSQRWFDRADANHDGKVTLAEAESGAMQLFDLADTDHDGTISPEERRAAMEMMRLMRHARGS